MTARTRPKPPADFTPVPVRARADGWTSVRQPRFIEALAASANVEAAARAVGMGTSSAYELRARPDAVAFRTAWAAALDYAVHRLGEAVLERALLGTVTPVFYKGEQVGERRRYDDRLAMFVLRMRDPERFGQWREGRMPMPSADAPAQRLGTAIRRLRGGTVAVPDEARLLSKPEEEAFIYSRAEREVDEARAKGLLPPDDGTDAHDDGDYRY